MEEKYLATVEQEISYAVALSDYLYFSRNTRLTG
jgi:hypothetical protein